MKCLHIRRVYCKTALTVDEAFKLVEVGFKYVAAFNDIMLS
ncbi:MAG: hypothetical protein QXM89_00840 [Candidatus Bathyarchaeia archaeon]